MLCLYSFLPGIYVKESHCDWRRGSIGQGAWQAGRRTVEYDVIYFEGGGSLCQIIQDLVRHCDDFIFYVKSVESIIHSIVSDSLQPHGLQPARLLCPWNSPGQNTGEGCHFLLQGIFPTQGSKPGLLHCRQIL